MRSAKHVVRVLAGLIAAASIVAAAACGGGGKTGEPGVAVGTPGAGGPTGLAEVDYLIKVAQSGNITELASLAGYEKVKCVTGTEGASPKCRGNESDGTAVEVLASSNCRRGWIRPEQVTDTLQSLLPSGSVHLFAVYQPEDDSDSYDGGFGSTYVVVLSTGKRTDGSPGGAALHVRDGRVAWLEQACSRIADLIEGKRVKSFVIPPVSSGATEPADAPAADVTPVHTATTTPG